MWGDKKIKNYRIVIRRMAFETGFLEQRAEITCTVRMRILKISCSLAVDFVRQPSYNYVTTEDMLWVLRRKNMRF